MKPEDIAVIVHRILGGDREAYGELVRAFHQDVWRVCAFSLHDISGTEEMVQRTFVRAYFKLDTFDPARDFRVWIRAVARNELRQEFRNRSRYQRRLQRYRIHVETHMVSNEQAERYEAGLRDALRRCQERLSGPTRRALEMRYCRSKDFGQIAGALGRSVAAARQLLQRARLALRLCIEERTVES